VKNHPAIVHRKPASKEANSATGDLPMQIRFGWDAQPDFLGAGSVFRADEKGQADGSPREDSGKSNFWRWRISLHTGKDAR
jgi:hypothetical protein